MRTLVASIAAVMAPAAWAHPHPPDCPPAPVVADCPQPEPNDATPNRSKYGARMLAFDRSRDKVGAGVGIGIVGIYGWVRVRVDHPAIKHVDARLAIAPAFALGDPHGIIASFQPSLMVGADLAFAPNGIVHPVLSLNTGIAMRSLIWTSPYPLATVGAMALFDPPGPFEVRVGLHGGLTGQRRTTTGDVLVPAFGWVPEVVFGATW